MAVGKYKKIMLLIRELLLRETDEKHTLTKKKICERIEAEHPDIVIGDREFTTDIDTLMDVGMDQGFILKKKAGQYETEYYVAERQIPLPSLQILVDMVLSSRFVTEKLSIEMINQLSTQTSIHYAAHLKPLVYVKGRVKSMNESIFNNCSIIQEAIREKKRISFDYCDWNTSKVLENKGKRYYVDPIAVIVREENFYLATPGKEVPDTYNYRIDKMLNVKLEKCHRKHGNEYYAEMTQAHVNRMFGMFSGKEERVSIAVIPKKVGVIIDRFGKEITLIPYDKDRWRAVVYVEPSPHFWGWIYSMADIMDIVGPKHVVDAYDEYMKKEFIKRFGEDAVNINR